MDSLDYSMLVHSIPMYALCFFNEKIYDLCMGLCPVYGCMVYTDIYYLLLRGWVHNIIYLIISNLCFAICFGLFMTLDSYAFNILHSEILYGCY